MKCGLRAWMMQDADALANALNNLEIQKNLRDGIPYPYTITDAQDYIRGTLQAPEGSRYTWAVTVDDIVAGSVGIFRKENIHYRTAELGYYLAQPYWGQGIMTQVVRRACDIVFATTDVVRVFAEPFAHNVGSCRVLEKVGFTCEGTLRKNAEKNGELIDMQLYALVKE